MDLARSVGDGVGSDAAVQAMENARAGKRSPGVSADADAAGGVKKRRKQLKPVRIATDDHVPHSLPSHMVQVPKDDADLVSCREPALVPPAKPPRCPLRDVPFQNDNLGEPPSYVPTPDSGPSLPDPMFNGLSGPAFPYQPWTDRTHKIFNQEAYCELCKKEFCNKYFLKTHKANKHGIYSAESNGSARHYVEPVAALAEPMDNECPAGDPDDKLRAYCDLCHKGFCNKYFVRRHKTKTHGIEDLEDVNTVQITSTNDARSTLNLSDSQDSDSLFDREDKEEPLNLVVNAESEVSSEGRPEDCTENLEKLQTMLLRLRPDGEDALRLRAEGEQEPQGDQSEDSSEPEQVTGVQEQEMCGAPIGRKHSKPTSSYCEICNKELCNKYFMRTHMQRMHGIELEHGAQIGGVVCNICNKELCSKYFLRVHKQNTHGIPGPTGLPTLRPEAKAPAPPRPGFTQVCLICSKRFRSSKWLQAHLQSDHREHREAQPDAAADAPIDVISKLLWEGSSVAGAFSCSQCPFTTPVLAFLFVHERSHVVGAGDGAEAVKPSLALQDLIHHKTFWQHAITQPAAGLDLSAPTHSAHHS